MNESDSWVEEYLAPRYPELVKPYREASAIEAKAAASGTLSKAQLEKLVLHAQSPRTPLGENVASMLGQLADRFPEVQNKIRVLAADSRVHVRINALVALSSHELGALHGELLAVALTDKSVRVRALAADKIMGFGIRSLIPNLERAVENESNAKRRAALEWELALLRDGYLLTSSDGRISVTCRSSAGVVSTSFSEQEFETKGRKWITQQLAQ